jgi:pimeloyl-ACP methyl ester carboxylesterase
MTKGTYEELLRKIKKGNPTWPEETFKPWVESKIQYREKNKRYILGLAKSPYNWKEIVQTISCPLLLISSSKGITNDKNAKKVMELSKEGIWVKIEGAGHNIRREQSEKFMEAILDFMD